MLKMIVQWVAEDGAVFDTAEDAEKHQEMVGRIDLIRSSMDVDGGCVSAETVLEFVEKYTKGWK